MKKFSLVCLVLLFVSMVAYGTDYWYSDNPNCIRTISGYSYVGIGGSASGYRLNVCGTLRTVNFKMSNGAVKDYVLTCAGSAGGAVWKPASGGGSCLWTGDASEIYYNGNVGIGETNPQAFLEIHGGNGTTKEKIKIGDLHIGPNLGAEAEYTRWYLGYNIYWEGTWNEGEWVNTNDNNRSIFINDNETLRFIADLVGSSWTTEELRDYTKFSVTKQGNGYFAGNVGIGTTNPESYKLAVNGHIKTKAITVESDWSDFVFEDDYQLMPLETLEKHIKTYNSLPGIPTEKEVKENGIEIGEMQAKLLEKVEELTLYVIELKKENTELKKRINALEN